jgi:protein TonB
VIPILEPVAPAPAPEPVAAEPAPPRATPVVPPPAAPGGSSSVPEGRSAASEAEGGHLARGDGPVRRDSESAPGGAPGSPLALATPGAGGAGGPAAEYGAYLRRFRQRVLESLVYPLAARRQGLAGTVELHVWLEPTGRVRDVQIARSSSHDVLDDAAVETIRRLGPVPFPDSVPRRPLLIRIPLVYELR